MTERSVRGDWILGKTIQTLSHVQAIDLAWEVSWVSLETLSGVNGSLFVLSLAHGVRQLQRAPYRSLALQRLRQHVVDRDRSN